MHAREALNFFFRQSARAEKGFVAAANSRNRPLAALNARQLFKTRLMQGLIKWRQLQDPTIDLNSALDAVDSGFEILLTLDASTRVGSELPLEKAAIVAQLIDRPVRYRQDLSDVDAVDRRLDCLLIAALCHEPMQDALAIEMERLSKERIDASVAKNYRTYFELLNEPSSSVALESLISVAEDNFKQRSTGGFYFGGEQTEGGGPDNRLIVDYRLGVILKAQNHSANSVHAWRW